MKNDGVTITQNKRNNLGVLHNRSKSTKSTEYSEQRLNFGKMEPIRKFNRFELKYLLTIEQANELNEQTKYAPGGVNRGERENTRNGENTLKDRFFANENFSAMYEERYLEIAETIFCNDLLLEKLDAISDTFTEYNSENNLLNQDEYDREVQDVKSYIENKKEEIC